MSSWPRIISYRFHYIRARVEAASYAVMQTNTLVAFFTGCFPVDTKGEAPKAEQATSEEPKAEEAKPEEPKQEEQPAAEAGDDKKEGGEKDVLLGC